MTDNTYQCSCCGGTFEYGWSDDMATAELGQVFPGFDKADCAVVCDDCYRRMVPVYGPPEDWLKDIPKPMREIYRAMYAEVEEKVAKAFEDSILYGTGTMEIGGLH